MKTAKTFYLVMMVSLFLVSIVGCKKKDDVKPNTTTTNPPAATYTNRTIEVALMDYNDASGNNFGFNTTAYVIVGSSKIDSFPLLQSTVGGPVNTIPDACTTQGSMNLNNHSYKTQDNTTNYLDIYDGPNRLVRYEIKLVSSLWRLVPDNTTISAGCTVYNLPCQSTNPYGCIQR
jgi:hypothetical protein